MLNGAAVRTSAAGATARAGVALRFGAELTLHAGDVLEVAMR